MNRATKGFTIGGHVVVDEASVWSDAGNVNRIHEVVAARRANGVYAYTVAPVTSRGPDRTLALEVTGADLREVRS